MKQLEQIILSTGLVSIQELNEAIFAAPQSSLIEALAQVIDPEREEQLLKKLSLALKAPLVEGAAIEVAGDLPAADFIGLVGQHKALPLAVKQTASGPRLILAMVNPLDEAAKSAFGALFRVEVESKLAREREIFKAFSRYGNGRGRSSSETERTNLAANQQPQTGNVPYHNADPEVVRALQQIVATAVKHTAHSVEISLASPFTRAVFHLKEGLQTAVEISVHPQQLAATVIERTQVVEHEPGMFRGIARIEFKTLSINCVVSFERKNGQISNEKGVLRLTDFLFDVSENPHFWAGLSDDNAKNMRGLLNDSPGVVLVISPEAAERELLLRTIAESCPDLQIEDRVADLVYRLDLFDRALGQRLIVGVDGEDIFPILQLLDRLPPARRQLIAGLIAFRTLPRECPVCVERKPAPADSLLELPEYYRSLALHRPETPGCDICSGRKILGGVGAVSILNLSTGAGELFQGGARSTDVLRVLAADGFESLFEAALEIVDQGVVSLEHVLSAVSLPPAEYTEARSGSAESALEARESARAKAPAARSIFDDGRIEGVSFELESGGASPAKSSVPVQLVRREEPLRGTAAFVARRQNGEGAPAIAGHGSGDNGTVSNDPAGSPQSQLLLVIDDDADQRAVLKKVLEIAGYRVEVAADGVDGILTATREHPQLIIVDFMMPKIDGKETIRRLRSSPSTARIPIIALTAFSNPEVEFGLLNAGADDFCPKSISKKVLLKRIEKLTTAPSPV